MMFSVLITLFIFEIFLITKNWLTPNYDVEMWKYSKSLKEKSENPAIGHVHKKNKTKVLQNVIIKTNNFGIRGDDISNNNVSERKIIIIGSSIPLGWGVKEKNTVSSKLEQIAKKNGLKWSVYNAGIGNYNAERYINNYLENLSTIETDTIVVIYFVNDTEILNNNYGNFFTRNFQTAVLIWKFYHSLNQNLGIEKLEEYYKKKYDVNFKGYQDAVNSLSKLSEHCKLNNKACVLAIMPDIHQMEPYKLDFIHTKMQIISEELNFNFIDFLPEIKKVEAKKLWNDYKDPHPNAIGHSIMAKVLFENIK